MYWRRFLIVFAIFVIVVLGVIWIWPDKSDDPAVDAPEEAPKTLLEYGDSDASMRFINDGAINGEEDHRRIRMTISRDQRLLEVIAGYQNNVIAQERLDNNQAAFEAFLAALKNSGFTDSRVNPQESVAPEAACPTGRRMWYEISERGELIQSLWGASCISKVGTFAGSEDVIDNLFESQFPNYRDVTRGVRL